MIISLERDPEIPYMGNLLAGTDEAGRGPLAGDLYAAAVILDPDTPIAGLDDSKKLSAKRREALFDKICEQALAWNISIATVEEVDQLDVLQASMLAMQRAAEALNPVPDFVAVDGNRLPKWSFASIALVKGDSRVAEISAASILAKVARDRHMQEMHQAYPRYGFDKHKGYPTKQHIEMLREFGSCRIHRQSYRPVQQADLFTS
jgi:ribonuclease HII|tara:strand:- start:92699 stop:93313 length:615 start_codon:yes stop_codon:yes gene_type:complete